MLENYYFNEDDYKIFDTENVSSIRPEIIEKRKIVQQKLFDINDDIKDILRNKNLHNHWRNENITSLIYPCVFNLGKVSWLGIRYGRSKEEVNQLNYNLGVNSKERKGFQKHACFQINIEKKGVAIGLYHAVAEGAIDRMFLHENIDNKKDILINEIKKIQGYGFVWDIWDKQDTNYRFEFDNHNPEDFIDFYKINDMDGRTSFLLYLIPKKDKRIQTKKGIEEISLEIIDMLYDFYNEIIWKEKRAN